MHVLIVGINGFLGRTLAETCLKQGITVDGIYHNHRDLIPKGCSIHSLSHLGRLHDPYDVVFMAAAAIPYPGRAMSESDVVQTNTQLPLQVALQFSKSFLVFTSSVSVYGQPAVSRITERTRPNNPDQYGRSKLAAESLLMRYHKNTAIIRFSSLYGKGMYPGTFLPRIIEDAKKKKKITVFGDGQRKQDYLHVSDAATLCLTAGTHQNLGTYLGAYGSSYTNTAVAQRVCSHIPGCTIRYAGIDTSPSYSYDATYTKKQLHFVPLISIEQGIEHML